MKHVSKPHFNRVPPEEPVFTKMTNVGDLVVDPDSFQTFEISSTIPKGATHFSVELHETYDDPDQICIFFLKLSESPPEEKEALQKDYDYKMADFKKAQEEYKAELKLYQAQVEAEEKKLYEKLKKKYG